MQLVRKFRIPALFCALAVLLCELVSRPYANMGVCDDGPYILMAQHLAATGHIVYNGWAAAMLGWQLYLAAGLIKLFGFSFTTVRMSTLLIAMALAFVLQRTLVRAGISEHNATIGTLALVLSPLYLTLSVTFMTDIQGLFAIVLCLYGCLRALQAASDRSTILWLCFALAANAIIGTSRQIAWLGILVMVPSALWLLRSRRRVFFAGIASTLLSALFIFACLQWFNHQPYTSHVALLSRQFPIVKSFEQITSLLLDIAFLLLPIVALFLPQIRKSRPAIIAAICAFFLVYLFLAFHPQYRHGVFELEPAHGDWVTIHGFFETNRFQGSPPVFLNLGAQTLLTILSIGGLLGLVVSLLRPWQTHPALDSSTTVISWRELATLLVPFSLAYILLLISAFTNTGYLVDRYLLGLLIVALLCLVRYFQQSIRRRLPSAAILLVAASSIYSIALTHNMFSFYRARAALAAELTARGVPNTSVDGGWEHNLDVELKYSNHVNYPFITVPAHAYVRTPPPPPGHCSAFWNDYTPHIHPIYGLSFSPGACDGPAPFPPVHYSRWLASNPGTLYVVNYLAPMKP